MRSEDVETQARQLYDSLGPQAIATAARRASESERSGAAETARTWRRIESRLRERRGPRQT